MPSAYAGIAPAMIAAASASAAIPRQDLINIAFLPSFELSTISGWYVPHPAEWPPS
jgi:hypothetical protein